MKIQPLLILLLGTFLSSTVAFSQATKKEEGIKLGFKTGLNVSNFMSNDIENNTVRTSIHFGFLSEIIISDEVSFQPELLYSGQGFVGADTKQKFNYINIPLLLKYYVTDNFTVEAGPQVGFLIKSYSRGNLGNTNIKDQNFLDFGVNLGLGFELKNNIFFQTRYNLGLVNINAASNNDTMNYTNSVFQLSVGYMF